MGEVIDIDEHRPDKQNRLQCPECDYVWIGAYYSTSEKLQCPKCKRYTQELGLLNQTKTCKTCGSKWRALPTDKSDMCFSCFIKDIK